ncbi:hypothetical protein PR048_010737 [Dryococelus australis]|uniref:Transposase n=1 Tax=Dryococelus australis TaxID=614101 RepID=A0ABQ9I3K8_9NEOP|nr:hypothetical protein PR048_010737 [Dryococelus australis]
MTNTLHVITGENSLDNERHYSISLKSVSEKAYRYLRKRAQQLKCDSEVLCYVLALMKSKSKNLTDFEKIIVLSFDKIKISISHGLLQKWKKLIYHDFDKPMAKEILKDVIVRVEESGFKVVAIISGMGGRNSANAYPYDNNGNIFVFADVPHLINLARNHFLDKGFIVEGNYINEGHHEFKIAHKLTQRQLDVVGCARQNVKPALQIFSNSVSRALLF